MKKLCLGIILALCTCIAFSQVTLKRSVISSSGGFKNSRSSSLALINSTGQSAIRANYNEELILFQGFIQPLDLTIGVEFFDITLFPNPSDGLIYFSTESIEVGKLEFDVFSLEGRLVERAMSTSENGFLDLSRLDKGVYTLIINNMGKYIGTKKIILK